MTEPSNPRPSRSPMPRVVSTAGTPAEPDDLFHAVALAAFVAVAEETGGWPDGERVKRLAYRWYEEELRRANAEQ